MKNLWFEERSIYLETLLENYAIEWQNETEQCYSEIEDKEHIIADLAIKMADLASYYMGRIDAHEGEGSCPTPSEVWEIVKESK